MKETLIRVRLVSRAQIAPPKLELKESKLVCLSPEGDNFKEHQLNNKKVMKILGLDDGFWKEFWPTRQPQWDGIPINDEKKFTAVYLIEAKSHIHEFVSRGSK